MRHYVFFGRIFIIIIIVAVAGVGAGSIKTTLTHCVCYVNLL